MDIETDFALALDIGHALINTHIPVVKISVKVGNLWFYFLVWGLKLLAIKDGEQKQKLCIGPSHWSGCN